MASIQNILALAAAGALVSACNPDGSRVSSVANRSLESVHQPVVERTDYVFDAAASGAGLAPGEDARLDEWFASLDVGYGDRVFVDGADGRARGDVARVAADYGLLLSDGAPVTAGTVQPGTVRVIVSRSRATVPGCPDWNEFDGPSATSSNYGCAVNSNLAAMVADPSDLVLGQEGSGTDARTASKAIKLYRESEPTGKKGLTETSTTKGKDK